MRGVAPRLVLQAGEQLRHFFDSRLLAIVEGAGAAPCWGQLEEIKRIAGMHSRRNVPWNAPTGGRPRILIVEDDALIAWDIGLMLEDAGFELQGMVATGSEALEQAATTQPDVVLMDVNLHGTMDGVETAQAMRGSGIKAPIIFVTGFGDPETARRIRDVDADGYLLKPVMLRELEAAIIHALRTPRE